MEILFKMSLLSSLLYFQTQFKNIYLQSEIFNLKHLKWLLFKMEHQWSLDLWKLPFTGRTLLSCLHRQHLRWRLKLWELLYLVFELISSTWKTHQALRASIVHINVLDPVGKYELQSNLLLARYKRFSPEKNSRQDGCKSAIRAAPLPICAT